MQQQEADRIEQEKSDRKKRQELEYKKQQKIAKEKARQSQAFQDVTEAETQSSYTTPMTSSGTFYFPITTLIIRPFIFIID